MPYAHLTLDRADHVATITLNRPDAFNALNLGLGRDLFDAANQPKEFWAVEGADHNDLLHTAGPDYVPRLRAFYSHLLP